METVKVLIREDEVLERVKELAAQISEDYAGKELLVLCILRGGVFFACELAKRITLPVVMDFMAVSSYGDGMESAGKVKIIKDMDSSIEGKHVLIAEDIIDTGNTLKALTELLKERKPADLRICTLLDKPSRRIQQKIKPDYNGFSIPDAFVVGMGLDYAQRYRNLPYIGVVELKEE